MNFCTTTKRSSLSVKTPQFLFLFTEQASIFLKKKGPISFEKVNYPCFLFTIRYYFGGAQTKWLILIKTSFFKLEFMAEGHLAQKMNNIFPEHASPIYSVLIWLFFFSLFFPCACTGVLPKNVMHK